MTKQQGRKIGRWSRKPTNKLYKDKSRRYHNKLKRVRQSNGEKAAREYEARRPCHTKRYGGRRE